MDWPRLIDTPRLCLRDLRPADAPGMFAGYTADPEVMRYLGIRPHQKVEDTLQQISYDGFRWLKGSAWLWGLGLKQPGRPAGEIIGQVELVPQSHPSDEAHHLRLGYFMGRRHWGQGLMAEAVQAVLQAAFAQPQPQVWRVDALCDLDNPASAALLERVGMQCEGRMRRAVVHPNVSADPRDAWLFSVVRAAPTPHTAPAGAAQSR
jgi:RimJ/RimL family protein N-acetyltransferase